MSYVGPDTYVASHVTLEWNGIFEGLVGSKSAETASYRLWGLYFGEFLQLLIWLCRDEYPNGNMRAVIRKLSVLIESAIFLSACAPSAQYALPPDLTLVPGTDIPQQVATYVADALTQTAMPPATSTPVPGAAILPLGLV